MAKLEATITINHAWQNVISETGDIEVMPIEFNHTFGADCSCAPTVELIGANLLVIHNSFDKREFIEQAISIMNEGV